LDLDEYTEESVSSADAAERLKNLYELMIAKAKQINDTCLMNPE